MLDALQHIVARNDKVKEQMQQFAEVLLEPCGCPHSSPAPQRPDQSESVGIHHRSRLLPWRCARCTSNHALLLIEVV